jgi:energy-coupling factor transporter transmembrane protein EcfT
MTTLTSTNRRTTTASPGAIAGTAFGLSAVFMVLINLFMNRPDHDNIASTDLYVGGIIAVGTLAVFVAARVGWGDSGRSAKASLMLGILVILATPLWFTLIQTTLGVGAVALAMRARERGNRSRSTIIGAALGGLGLLVGVVFVVGTFIHHLAG